MKKKFVFVPAMVVLFVLSPWASESAFADADPPTAGTFTIAVLPDTQHYSQSYPAIFTSQTQWIANHKAQHNIVFVLHEGDITNNNNATEWGNADASLSLLDGVVPYALALGNHDMGLGGSANNRNTMLNTYFPVRRFQNLPTFGGVYEPGKLDNSYHLFDAGGMDWLILALEFGPRDPVLDWANQVVADYPNRNVIVVTHCHMNYDDTLVGPGDSYNPHNYGVAGAPGGVNDGEETWDKFVRLHPNISFVFSGHILNDGKGRLVGIGDNRNKVYQMLANYQMLTNGGNGYLRLVEFDLSQQKVRVKTYSPYLDQHLRDIQNEFEFVWQVSIIPIVDFNGDFKIDIEDLIILIEHWGQDEPSVDIAPPPSGDGIVDVQDLEVFMSYWGQDVYDPTLIAHWKLDETEGSIAQDSVGDIDGTLNGNPVWQPTAGKVDGALEFDGIDDYVSTEFVLNPADGPFSVFVWVKGGAPGQVVISQTELGGANWLLADSSEGNLMTELKAKSRGAAALLSQTVITDGEWHRVGFVWNGSQRTLYVDGVAVAEDTEPQDHFVAVHGGLYFGAGKTLDAGSFFSGLIDDVRIYNRPVRPQEIEALAR
ncbi:MAG: hypothetical protein IIB56_11865 [Planctomycetes bacterium]|nr:hypothetical protein [Planctomycetota bacterium]